MKARTLTALLHDDPVLVTGIGAFCAAGTSVDELWRSVIAGTPKARWMSCHDGERIAACAAPDVDLRAPEFRPVRRMDRGAQLALAAARQAWADAGLHEESSSPPPDRRGVVVGTSRGPLAKWNEWMNHQANGGAMPSYASTCTVASVSGMLSMVFHVLGPACMVSAACSSSAHAMALGAEQILLGNAEVVLVGGTEATLLPPLVRQLKATGVLGSHSDPAWACRPFSADRNGTVLGDGSGFLVLESSASARNRGARAYARLAGWSVGSEARQRTGMSEDGDGLHQVMTRALDIARLSPEDVGYVNAHGTGTPLNDRAESHALARRFPSGVPCSSTKAVTGHCMGAGSALEAIISLLAVHHGALPPSAGLLVQDPECPVQLVHPEARPARLRAALSNSSGFWGTNAALVFAQP